MVKRETKKGCRGRGKRMRDKFREFPGINFDIEKYSKEKKVIADQIGNSVLNKMQSAFEWRGLPDTIPQKWLELQLLVNGFSFITRADDGNLYAFYGGLGGEPDPYYQPTICVVASPALDFNKECKIGTDGVLMSDDTLRRGLIPTIGKYAGLLAENTVTIRIADVAARVTSIISAADEGTVESAKEYLRQLEAGELGIIEESPFLEDLKVNPATSSGQSRLTDLIEMEQYLKASLYNEIGLQANYNMKREAVNSSEAQLGDDALQPLIDNMLAERQAGAEEINRLYGTDISVNFAGAWKDNEDERNAELEAVEKEAERQEGGGENGNQGEPDNNGDLPDSGDSSENEGEEN